MFIYSAFDGVSVGLKGVKVVLSILSIACPVGAVLESTNVVIIGMWRNDVCANASATRHEYILVGSTPASLLAKVAAAFTPMSIVSTNEPHRLLDKDLSLSSSFSISFNR